MGCDVLRADGREDGLRAVRKDGQAGDEGAQEEGVHGEEGHDHPGDKFQATTLVLLRVRWEHR